MTRIVIVLLALMLSAIGCGDDGEGGDPVAAAAGNPFQEAVDRGIARFFETTQPLSTAEPEPGVTTYEYDPADGPVCLFGDPYRFSIRDEGSDDLFIFLQGGGACWSDFCLAITLATTGIPRLDILDPDNPANPLRDVNTVYLPYCDGSLFAGATEHDDDADGIIDRTHHGLINLSATLDVAKERFPDPGRIVLTGSSGGSYGTIIATILVRTKWPGVDLFVFQDSGSGIGRAGEPEFIGKLAREFGFDQWLPASCEACLDNGHITRLVDWQLANDPQLRIAAFSSYEDLVISEVFLDVGGDAFRQALVEETAWLHARYPDRYKRFLIDGQMHTTLLGNVTGIVGDDITGLVVPPDAIGTLVNLELGGIETTTSGGTTIGAWFGGMLDDDPSWADITE